MTLRSHKHRRYYTIRTVICMITIIVTHRVSFIVFCIWPEHLIAVCRDAERVDMSCSDACLIKTTKPPASFPRTIQLFVDSFQPCRSICPCYVASAWSHEGRPTVRLNSCGRTTLATISAWWRWVFTFSHLCICGRMCEPNATDSQDEQQTTCAKLTDGACKLAVPAPGYPCCLSDK